MIDFDQAMLNPESVFADPKDVVACDDLSQEQKVAILRQWEYDAREMAVAEEENMPGNESDLLDRVIKALHALGAKVDIEHGGTKHGG